MSETLACPKWLFQAKSAKRSSQKVDLHRDFCRMAPLILLECDGHRPWKVAILSKPSVWPESREKKIRIRYNVTHVFLARMCYSFVKNNSRHNTSH